MKGGLCVIYTSLLAVSVFSSILFILVVSEALQADLYANTTIVASDLHHVGGSANGSVVHDAEPASVHEELAENRNVEKPVLEDKEMTFTETLSLNSVTTDGLPDTGQPPILISLVDTAKLELNPSGDLLFANDSDRRDDNETLNIVESHAGLDAGQEPTEAPPPVPATPETTLIVKARPVQEPRPPDEPPTTVTPPTLVPDIQHEDKSQTLVPDKGDSREGEEPSVVKAGVPQEDIPSFSEWAQKQLAEAEKHTVLNQSSQPPHSAANVSSKSSKLRSKNYASPACGAKVVAVNPEAGSAGAVLSPNPDEYMLNACTSRIWFVVELCEAVQAQRIEIANFELFSSTPKEFAVYFSDRPTRDWASVGQFTARDLRDVQSFDLYPHLFGKFIKVELLSHHGAEHYCPISLFKVYGTSEFEVLEKENAQHAAHADDDDEDEPAEPEPHAGDADTAKNLFGSARDAVMSIVKKAAQALVKTESPKNSTGERNDTIGGGSGDPCRSPSHIVVCDNCSDVLYGDVYQLISCGADRIAAALRATFLRDTLKCTPLCRPFGLDFKSTKTISFGHERASYLNALFPKKYIAALCNILAIDEKKVVLNTSFEDEHDSTNVTVEESHRTTNSVTSAEPDIELPVTNISRDDILNLTTVIQNKESKQEQLNDSDTRLNENDAVKHEKDESKITVNVKEDIVTVTEDKSSKESAEMQTENKTDVELGDKSKEIETQVKDQELKTESIISNDPKNGKPETNHDKLVKEGVATTGDEEQMLIENDNFMSEWNQLADSAPAGGPAQATPTTQQTLQKESVFLRLSNRVKTLERNMSLSGQYLEELSRRYKKQVEEMQKTFEKTVLQMSEERRRSGERESRYLDQLSQLRNQLDSLTTSMEALLEDRDSWFGNLTFFKFLVYQSIIVAAVLYYVSKRRREPILVPISKRSAKKKNQVKVRRKSVEGVSGHATPVAKKRRPSEEALRIERQSLEELEVEDGEEWQVARRPRRKKGIAVLHGNLVNGRIDPVGLLKDPVIALDDDEFIAPVSEPADFSANSRDPKRDFPKTNGSIFSSIRAKTMKSRRLSSPGFLRSFGRNSTRSMPPGAVATPDTTLEDPFERKAASESPASSLWSASTELSQPDGPALPKPKKRSFKNILKKVF